MRGLNVETVSNGVAAIKRLATMQPVVILADVSMPGRDGYEVCDFVKKSAQLSRVPVLLVASDMEPYDAARGAQVQADGRIKKPFEPHELISMVERFAAQFEASLKAGNTETLQVTPVPLPAPTREFFLTSEEPEELPPAADVAPADFSVVPEGVAFESEPAAEPEQAHSPELLTVETGETLPYPEPEVAQVAEPAAEAGDTVAAPQPPPSGESPVLVDEPQTSSSEPVFIEEKTVPMTLLPNIQAGTGTMIFRAPVEIAEPVWRDETVPSPPPPETSSAPALEPQLEAEAPPASPETSVEPSPAEELIEGPVVTATSLDSFSLDDAAAGQVTFASEEAEVASTETVPAEQAAETVSPEVLAEAVPAEAGPPEASSEVAATESSVEVAAPEIPAAAPAEVAASEMAAEAPAEITANEISAEAPAEAAAAETPTETPAEAPAEVPAPPAVLDWSTFFSIVHKVVVEMSPHALHADAMEEMARRVADEIAPEFGVVSPPPQV